MEMKNRQKNILIYVTVLIGIIFILNYEFFPDKSIPEYYSTLNSNSKILNQEQITAQELIAFKNCNDVQKCFLKFFQDFNSKNSLQESFSKLTLLMREHSEYQKHCHFIAHGIGKSELEKQNGDVGKAFEVFKSGNYFANMATCGTGYYHGIMEEAVKEIKNKDLLVGEFQNICSNESVKRISASDCIHGLGHATFIQTDYNLDDSLYVCEKLSKNDYDKFNCYTGIFMEAVLSLPGDFLVEKVGEEYDFKFCNNARSELQKSACHYELAMEFQNFVNDKNDFGEIIKLCSSIKSDLGRLACVKNISMRSIADANYNDLNKLCVQNNFNDREKVMCVAVYAHRLSLSIAGVKNKEYYKMTGDICKNLPFYLQNKCTALIVNNPDRLFLVTQNDLN